MSPENINLFIGVSYSLFMVDLVARVDGVESLGLHSLMAAIEERTDIEIADITKILAMCYDLDKTRAYLQVQNIRDFVSNFETEVFGFGQVPNQVEGLSHVRFYPTPERLTSHKSIIEVKGKPVFLWAEPDHNPDKDRRILWHHFKLGLPYDGAFLVALDNPETNEALKQLYSQFDSYKSK
jgi:acyl carrier protein